MLFTLLIKAIGLNSINISKALYGGVVVLGFCEIVLGRIQSDKSSPATEMQSQVAIKQKAFRPVEQIDLATGMQDIIAGTWEGIGLLDVMDGQTHIWGKQILIVETGIDRHRLKEQYSGMMIFTPAEFLDVMNDWPGTEGVIRAKRIFNGEIIGGFKR